MNTSRKDEDIILSHEFLEEMKRIREQRGISIEEVAEKTNIKASYIRAIEEGDLSRLPGGIYNRAFIRSISEFLGINTKPYERKVESDEMIKERQVRVEIGRPLNASMPSKVTIIGCLFVIFVLYSIFYGPRVSKKEQVENAIETYHEQQIEKAEEKMEATQNPQEQVAIQSELQQKLSDDSDLIRQIPQISPIKKETESSISKELVITLLATKNVKVVVKDYYGKIILNKEMVASEAMMLNGSDEYYMATDNINNLEIYLDGVQIRDVNKIQKQGSAYVFKADSLVGVVEAQPFSKQATIKTEPITTQNSQNLSGAVNPVSGASPQNANPTQNNPQGSGR